MSNDEVLLALSSEHLQLILLPTERCNFRCTYCYEDFSIGRMSEGVITGIKALLASRIPSLSTLSVDWFGGEPLLASDIIENVSSAVIADLRRLNNSVRFQSMVTTNAYLLSGAMFDRLCEVGVRGYQVTLDGPDEVHDRTRRRADGEGTFERIWANLKDISKRKTEFHVNLRVHLTPSNHTEIPRLMVRINEDFGHDRRFNVSFKAVEQLGGPGDASMKVLSHEESETLISSLQKAHLKSSEEAAVAAPAVCYASKANSFVIRANGDVAKCTVAFNDPRNRIGAIRSDGSLQMDQSQFRSWIRGLKSLDAATLACPLAGFPPLPRVGHLPIIK